MINSKNLKNLLSNTLAPVELESVPFSTDSLQSAALISVANGAIISYANTAQPGDSVSSLNNLKMMCLLCKDKWSEDEADLQSQSTKCCYRYQWQLDQGKPYETRIYTYEIEELRVCLAHLPESDLILVLFATQEYPYGLLVLKLKNCLKSFQNIYGYKLG
ncbi:Slm4p KNAG_0J02270 [Huiozyma naganishii CBS 8797]|uniref:Uncharacterized protein n=1 Tax=Huiozyma naganishii (strain ATCC MYA-139 / BCRC 22969 / CBS 8797 / KCTC 17520 / NBRC 10181 / NCYC 3082 / Yp74L-3) TaxID=1071383 RepID=J7RR36_HUIN7|nr:hypothetical protein KNAG_0J02270 [Kazachstania naganishii CBS 8797]CCK72308.1 hypothetical protein KNAG_0J02270 [Kazachstania naganishii CBS 8797]